MIAMKNEKSAYRGYRFPPVVIRRAVRWHSRFQLTCAPRPGSTSIRLRGHSLTRANSTNLTGNNTRPRTRHSGPRHAFEHGCADQSPERHRNVYPMPFL